MKDVDTGTVYSCHDQQWVNPNASVVTLSILEGLKLLSTATERIGHNTIKYDLKVIKKLYPEITLQGKDTDTLVLAKLIHPDIKTEDANNRRTSENFSHKGKALYGSHSLAAWGKRLGEYKLEYSEGFDTWSPEMQSYGEQDIETTYSLWMYLKPHTYSQEAIELEHRIAHILHQVEIDGIPFDIQKAAELQATLSNKRDELKRGLISLFPPWTVEVKRFTAKVDNKKLNRKKGDEIVVTKEVVFNPGSRDHIAYCLKRKYGWKPKDFTPTGKAQIDDEVLGELEYPEAKALAEYFIVCKTLAQVAEGEQNWMQHYDLRTRTIHAAYNPMGCVTSRCSHHSPNIGQVPAVDKPFGVECRSLFGFSTTHVLLGSDMSGLELRCLGHYLAFFDQGKYADIVVNGDVHTLNQQAAGLPTRNNAKTFIYGFLYGAGPEKIGSIVNGTVTTGRRLIKSFLAKTPALNSLRNYIYSSVGKGYLVALDGRHVPVRKPHAALNSLLQSAGAIICKRWVVGVLDSLKEQGLTYGSDYRIVAFIHDELQIMVRKGLEETVGTTCQQVAVKVGVDLGMKCPLAAEYKTGANWAETH
jgi:DNA polymerase I-like protein with 3'-5' exonuclease and polymerase domains